ncbi:hypothetical protein SAY86_013047 [Trapa natans]|uniref:CRC domain-containing protein n=1 Tax=Trapa natans TaxID=22666 RepID=A0AAN7MDV2_TRANT|nr:hypothetical protein SAY86_013047 [Trapa natans]
MDTPGKSHALSASASDYEVSPVFQYINNLSPLELKKSLGTNQPFNLLSSVSPLAVFASPQLDINKQHLKLLAGGHQLSGSSAFEFLENKNKDSSKQGALKSDKECHSIDGKSRFKSVISVENNAVMPTESVVNPDDSHTTRKHDEQRYASTVASSDPVLFSDVRNICDICHTEQIMQDSLKMVLAADSDSINFKSSNLVGNGVDPGTMVSTVDNAHHPDVNGNEKHELEYSSIVNSYVKEQNLDAPDPAISHATLLELRMSDPSADLDEENEEFAKSYRQSTFLRRCLFSEMATTHNSKDSSIFILDTGEAVKCEPQMSYVPLTLTTQCEAVSASDYLASADLSPMSSSDMNQVLSLRKDLILCDDGAPQSENDCHTSASPHKELDQHGPLMKRNRSEKDTEITSCKRCNCRRSKCLKLYCDCFAAGLYCIGPCSCQDCFNRLIFKDKVLETRKQIESRNPLAFAPKVIKGTDSDMGHGEEGTKTPASARHKQGCRCKRSSCLKKYCECFQVGVGCSFNCRCEGCKNTYGRKDEPQELEGRAGETSRRVRSLHVTAKYDESKEEYAYSNKREAANDRIQTEIPFTFPEIHGGTDPSKKEAPRAFSTSKFGSVDAFTGKHVLENEDELTRNAENQDVNREPPASKYSYTMGKGVHLSLPWSRPASASIAMSSRGRVILKSIASLPKTTETCSKD